MNSAGVALLNNGTGTGEYLAWPGGRGVFTAVATFGGGSVALQFLGPDGSTAVPAVNSATGVAASLTSAGAVLVDLPPCRVRAVATTATAVYARFDRVVE